MMQGVIDTAEISATANVEAKTNEAIWKETIESEV